MVSIVSNFYNSGKYIPRLMRSVADQTYADWQLVCVDDCSPSHDHKVIEQTARSLGIKDKVKLVVNPVNLGIAQAKKAGIDAADGEYVTFIDGDDWFAPEAIERMAVPMEQYGLDMVIMNYYRYYTWFYKQECRSNIQPEHWNTPLDQQTYTSNYLMNFFAENVYNVAYWAKMFRTEMLRQLDFEYPDRAHTVREDFLFNMAAAQAVGKVMFVDYAGYYWRYGGITTGNRSNADWSKRKYVLQNADMYPQRKALIEKYAYEGGMGPLVAQLKNLLMWTMSLNARRDGTSKEAVEAKEFMRQALQKPAYADISHLKGYNYEGENKRVIDAMIAGDVDTLYDICHATYKRQWKARAVNRLKHLVISPFL